MSPGEKKVAALLVVVLVAMIAVYFSTMPKPLPEGPSTMMPGMNMAQRGPAPAGPGGARMGPAAAGTQPSTASSCGPSAGGGGAAATQEFGKAGAKLEIIALLPVAHGCHVATEGELKKAYQSHPNDIHLTIVDLMGPEAAKYQQKLGVRWTVVSINGKSSFDRNGRKVALEKIENGSYAPGDIVPIIEAELAKAG